MKTTVVASAGEGARSTINLEQGYSVRNNSHNPDGGTVIGRARASLR